MTYQPRRKPLQQAVVFLAPAPDVDAEQELQAQVPVLEDDAEVIRDALPLLWPT